MDQQVGNWKMPWSRCTALPHTAYIRPFCCSYNFQFGLKSYPTCQEAFSPSSTGVSFCRKCSNSLGGDCKLEPLPVNTNSFHIWTCWMGSLCCSCLRLLYKEMMNPCPSPLLPRFRKRYPVQLLPWPRSNSSVPLRQTETRTRKRCCSFRLQTNILLSAWCRFEMTSQGKTKCEVWMSRA